MVNRLFKKTLAAISALILGGAAMAQAGTVKGTVTYLERIAVPPGAVLDVQLLDVSRMDVPATVLSEMRYALDRVPFPFALAYDDALIDERMSYNVAAKILVEDKVMYRSTSAHPVLTRGAGDSVDIVVQRMAAAAAAPMASGLDDTAWTVTDLHGKLLITERKPAIRFAKEGQFGADSTCNKYAGAALIDGNSVRFPEAMAGTRMACADPYDTIEREFIKALGEVSGYVINDKGGMALTNDAGMAVLRLIPQT